MKKVKIIALVTGIMVSAYIALVLSGCNANQGAPGAPGVTGPNGPTGLNGVSNIKIQVYTVTTWAFQPTPPSGIPYYYSTVANSEITDPAKEAVTSYYSLSNTGGKYNWQPLPAIDVLGPGDQLGFGWTTNYVTFTYDSVGVYTAPSPTIYFNVAVIPPAIMKQHPNTNWKNAREVMNLPEMQAAMEAIKN